MYLKHSQNIESIIFKSLKKLDRPSNFRYREKFSCNFKFAKDLSSISDALIAKQPVCRKKYKNEKRKIFE